MTPSEKDTIYQKQNSPNPFSFNEKVAQVFSDMIHRSVPSYASNKTPINKIIKHFAQNNSYCYDLGCSLAEISLTLSQQKLPFKKIIAIDNSPSMIDKARENQQKIQSQTTITLECADILNYNYQPTSVFILNYTLQFLKPSKRNQLFKTLYTNLLPNGILLMAEKTKAQHKEGQNLLNEIYHQHKIDNHYHQLEISRKREALENILIPETIQQHHRRFAQTGFKYWQIWHQQYHFVSWVIVK